MTADTASMFTIKGTVLGPSAIPRLGIRVVAVDVVDEQQTRPEVVVFAISGEDGRFSLQFSPEQALRLFRVGRDEEIGRVARPLASRTRRLAILAHSDSRVVGRLDLPITLDELARGYEVILETTTAGEKVAVYTAAYQVSGVLLYDSGQPAAGVDIQVLHQRLRGEDVIALGPTGSDGSFRLSYDPASLLGDDGKGFAVVVRALDPEIPTPKELVRSERFCPAPRTLEVVLTLPAVPDDLTEIERIGPRINARREALPWDELTDDDAELISCQLGLPLSQVVLYIRSMQLAESSELPVEVFYALGARGVPPSVAAVGAMPPAVLQQSLEDAAARGLVPPWTDLTDLVESVGATMGARAVANSGDAPLGQLLAAAGLSETLRESFLVGYVGRSGTVAEFWADFAGTHTTAELEQARFGLHASALANDHLPLVEALEARRQAELLRVPRDLAALRFEDWQAIVSGTGGSTGAGAPASYPGADLAEREHLYAVALTRAAEEAFPTAAIVRRVAATSRWGLAAAYVTEHPGLDFRTTNARQYLASNPPTGLTTEEQETLRQQLSEAQRLFMVAPRFDRDQVAVTLLDAGIHSAHQIVEMGPSGFVEAHGALLGEDVARVVFDNAHHVSATLATMALRHSPALNPYQLPAGGGGEAVPSGDAPPDLEGLFGPLDYCACTHCRSVLSPAAYLVDVLRFLEQRPALAGEEEEPESALAPFAVLVERRPDLIHTLLDCANTNTPLPTIDLVNEILEREVVDTTPTTWPQTTRSEQELRAQPEHRLDAAYDVLRTAVYPWTLPFDLAQAESEAFLGHLGVTRHELLAACGEASSSLGEVVARARLGLTELAARIIAGEPVGATLLELWGVEDWDTVGDVPGFLELTQLDFAGLQELCATGYASGGALEIHFETPCQLDGATVENLDEARLARIHRFLRLQRALGWTIAETDAVVVALASAGSNPLDMTCVRAIARWLALHERFGSLPRRELRVWFADLSTVAPTQGGRSHYEEIFVEITAQGDPSPLALGQPTVSLASVLPRLAAALSRTEDEVSRLLALDPARTTTTVANLSWLYRWSSLARALRLRVEELVALVELTGIVPFETLGAAALDAVEQLVRTHDAIARSRVSVLELDALLRHQGSEPAGISAAAIAALLVELVRGLQAVRGELTAALDASRPRASVLVEQLERVVAAADIALVLEKVREVPEVDPTELEPLPSALAPWLSTTLWNELQDAPPALDPLLDVDHRAALVLDQLVPYLRGRLMEGVVVRKLGEAFALSPGGTRMLLALEPSPAAPRLSLFVGEAAGLVDTIDFTSQTGALADPAFPTWLEDGGGGFSSCADQFDAIRWLAKAAALVGQLRLGDDDLRWLLDGHAVTYALLSPASLPTEIVSGASSLLGPWLSLQRWAAFGREHTGGLPALRAALEEAGSAGFRAALARATGWEDDSLAAEASSIEAVADQRSIELVAQAPSVDDLWQLADAFVLARRLGVTAARACDWAVLEPTTAIARDIQAAAKAQVPAERWPSVIEPLRDALRQRQRDALVAYVLAHDPDARTPDDLFGRLLIDTQVSACAKTSRIKQALASVQTFVQRVQLNLEPGVNLSPSASNEWQWMSRYRVWEANRKIFLWPENWLQPELRDDKSELFGAFENVLLEREVSDAAAEAAVTEYVRQLEEIAQLHVAGIYHERELGPAETLVVDRLHVFARTKAKPYRYFYRVRVDDSYWTPWESVPLQIDAESVIPAVLQRRLVVAWCIYQERSKDEETPPVRYHEVRLMWSVLDHGTWGPVHTAEHTSNDMGIPVGVPPGESLATENVWLRVGNPSRFFFTSYIATTGELVIAPGFEVQTPSPGYFAYPARFALAGVDAEPVVFALEQKDRAQIALVDIDEAWLPRPRAMTPRQQWYVLDEKKFTKQQLAALGLQVPTRSANGGAFSFQKLFSPAFAGYTLAASMQYPGFACQSPFVYQDRRRSLFVVPRHSVAPTGEAVPTGGSGEAPSMEELGSFAHAKFLPAPAAADFAGGGSVSEWDHDLAEYAVPPKAPATSAAYNAFESWSFELSAFSHPLVYRVVDVLRRHGVEGIYRPPEDGEWAQLRRQLWRFNVNSFYDQTNLISSGSIVDEFDFGFSGAYSVYNWELFFHVPMYVALRLAEDKKFAEARRWMHFVFDPTEGGNTPTPSRYWRVKPLFESETSDVAEQLESLQYVGDDAAKNKLRTETLDEIGQWRKNPLRPHALARLRVSAYQRWVVMRYLDNLVEWGDHLFRQDTIESNNEALQLYVLAAQLLGPRPTVLPAQDAAGMTYADVQDSIDEFSNFLAQAENSIPAIALDKKGGAGLAKLAAATFDIQPIAGFRKVRMAEIVTPSEFTISLTQMIGYSYVATLGSEEETPRLYFCVPHNEQLLRYWDVVEDRLFKLRHCLNIEGVARQLPLFEPPIDPGLLAQAVATGVDLSTALSDIGAPLPHYRFSTMLGLAKELAAEVRGFGSALSEALRSADAEELAELRATQESKLLVTLRQVREQRITEAEEAVRSIERAIEISRHRIEHYEILVASGLTKREQKQLGKLTESRRSTIVADTIEAIAGALAIIPQFGAGTSGNGFHVVAEFGGQQFAAGTRAGAIIARGFAQAQQASAGISGIEASNERRAEEWTFQADQAKRERSRLQQDLVGAKLRVEIARRELSDHDAQLANAQQVDAYLRERYTNAELHRWLGSELSRSYFQAYQLAFEIAKQAQRCYRHELGLPDASFVEFGYWDNRHKGLLAGERLLHDLRRMETSYLANNRREYELTKRVSLARLDPFALLRLRQNASCYVNLPEALFEVDFPSHYMRRLRSVRLSVIGNTGPFDAVPVTLTLVGSRVRTSTNYTDPDQPVVDSGFATQSIATSTGQSDAGLFDANLRDERYLPFEGRGAASSWRIELPSELRSFDYDEIADVVIELQYTAREGGSAFAGQVLGSAGVNVRARLDAIDLGSTDYGDGRMWGWSVRSRFPEAWAAFRQPEAGRPIGTELVLGPEHYPRPLTGSSLQVLQVYVVLFAGTPSGTIGVSVTAPGGSPQTGTLGVSTALPGVFVAGPISTSGASAFGTWEIELDEAYTGDPSSFEDLILVVRYTEGT